MLDHFSRSELACPTTGKVYLATNFSEAPERLRVELDASLYRTSALWSPALIQGRPVVLAEAEADTLAAAAASSGCGGEMGL